MERKYEIILKHRLVLVVDHRLLFMLEKPIGGVWRSITRLCEAAVLRLNVVIVRVILGALWLLEIAVVYDLGRLSLLFVHVVEIVILNW